MRARSVVTRLLVGSYCSFRVLHAAADGSVETLLDNRPGSACRCRRTSRSSASLTRLVLTSLGGTWLSALDTPFIGVPANRPA
jgi:hypothetical protein